MCVYIYIYKNITFIPSQVSFSRPDPSPSVLDFAQPGPPSPPRSPLRPGAAPPTSDLAQPGPSPLPRAVGRVEPLMPVMGMKLGTLTKDIYIYIYTYYII